MSDGSSLSSSSHNETESSSSVEETSEDDEVTRKRARYACTFRPESNSFKWAKSSRKGPSFAFCTVCSRDISIAYVGNKDLKRHELTSVHQSASTSVKATRSLTAYFTNASGPKREQAVVEAEVKFSYFIGEHHLALALADHCSRLFPSLFPDSAVAKAFKCGRTKATAILKVIAQEVIEDLLSRLEESRFFSVHSDESTDITVQQQCAIMLRFFDNNDGKVRCAFLKLEPVQKADADGLFEALNKNFTAEGPICYTNLVGMGLDGANVMLGTRNSVLTRLTAKQSSLIAFHCNCHIAALIANHACHVLPDYLEDLTTHIWYYFQKSPKRQRTFQEFQAFVDVKPHKLLKAAQTRWLSLEACVQRLLEQYDALLSYFRSTEETLASVRRITSGLENPLSKLYIMFLCDSLPIVNIFNKTMQLQKPTIHFLYQEVQSFVKKLLLRFMQPSVVQNSHIGTIDLDDASNYIALEEVFIGEKARKCLTEETHLVTSEVRSFQETCRNFWVAAAKYAVKKLPVENDFLTNLTWLLPRVHDYNNVGKVLLTASCLPQVITEEDKAQLREEFMDYCTSELPSDFTQASTHEVDTYWHAIGQLKDTDAKVRYPLLTRLAKSVLIIPHGNADVERMFSHLGLNKTKLRNSLGADTLTALLQLQCNIKEPCFTFKPTTRMLLRCRNAIASLCDSKSD